MTPVRDELQVRILSAVSEEAPARSVIDYEVVNAGTRSAWLVVDDWFVWKSEGCKLTLSLARGPMRPSAVPFGYFDPEVEEIPTAGRWRRRRTLEWPLELSPLWNEQAKADPPAGDCALRIEVGYGWTPKPPPARSAGEIEASVLGWQRKAVSPPVALRVPPLAAAERRRGGEP